MSPLPQAFRKTEFTHRRGLAADRPAANEVLVGTLYFSTDLSLLERSNGTSWQSFAGTGGGGGGGPITETVLTEADETATLVNSRQLIAGANISLDNSVAGELTVNGVPTAPLIHAPSHLSAGGDPVDVKLLAGFPGGGTTFLRDDATFAAPPTPPPSGAEVLLASKTIVSGNPSLDFITRDAPMSGAIFQTDYDLYIIEIENISPLVDAHIGWRYSSDGGATWISANYYYAAQWLVNSPSTGVYNDTSVSSAYGVVMDSVESSQVDGLRGYSGTLTLWRPSRAEQHKFQAFGTGWAASSQLNGVRYHGWLGNPVVCNAIRFFAHTGNLQSGRVRIFGK